MFDVVCDLWTQLLQGFFAWICRTELRKLYKFFLQLFILLKVFELVQTSLINNFLLEHFKLLIYTLSPYSFHITGRNIYRLTFNLIGRIVTLYLSLRRLGLVFDYLSQYLLPEILLQILDQIVIARRIDLLCVALDQCSWIYWLNLIPWLNMLLGCQTQFTPVVFDFLLKKGIRRSERIQLFLSDILRILSCKIITILVPVYVMK